MVYSQNLAATAVLFRYVSSAEVSSIKTNERIQSLGRDTFLSPDVYSTASGAQAYLALPFTPDYQVGPIDSQRVVFDGVSLRRVVMRFGQPGGGLEVSTYQAIPYGTTTRL